ncbi:MAG: extracellular solute-binding protein [Chloroflexi bacterium]|nr:extracellular solute-binding protein [Chloroflexota bacterium]
MRVNLGVKIVLLIFWIITGCTPELVITPDQSTGTPTPGIVLTDTPVPSTTPTIAVSTLDITAEDLADTALEFWHPWGFENESALLTLTEQFNAENPWEISITALGRGNDLSWRIREGIPSNVLPNLTVGDSSQIRDWERRGDRIVDINLYLDDPIWGFSPEEGADFYTAFWNDDLADSKRIGLPAYRSAMILFYNQSWAKELGFSSPPTTPAEFREQVCAPIGVSSDHAAGWLASLDSTTALSWLYAFGGSIVMDGGYNLAAPQGEDTFVFLEDLFSNGCAWRPDPLDIYQEFAARQGLFLSSSLAGLGAQAAAFQEAGNTDNWVVIPFPSVDGQPVLTTYGLSYVIFQGTPAEQLASWLFIRWMNQPQQQAVWLTTTSSLSTRGSTMELMDNFILDLPQWGQAQDLILYSHSEPTLSSWFVARWAFQDAFNQLLGPNFSPEQIPDLLHELDALLDDIHAQNL